MPRASSPRARAAASPLRNRISNTAPAYIEPMKALGVDEIAGDHWLLEIKYDGYRALSVCENGRVEMWSRNQKTLSDHYPEIIVALEKMKLSDAVLDGEVVALDPEGRPSFQLLQNRGDAANNAPLYYYVFDVVHFDGQSLIDEPIEKRKEILGKILKKAPSQIRLSPTFDEDPEVLLEQARTQGLEGIVGKRKGSVYEPGRRSGAWAKKRISHDQEFVIGGFTAPRRGRLHFGAILVGFYDQGRLLYCGKVGTGFDGKKLKSLRQQFAKIETTSCPFENLPMARKPRYGLGMTAAAMREVTWVKPMMVAQIKFSEWTREASLRQPVFLGLREDKPATEVVREKSSG